MGSNSRELDYLTHVTCLEHLQDGSAAKELAYIKRHEFVESPQWAARNLFVARGRVVGSVLCSSHGGRLV